ncbi:uncharacterized protein VTP21DRAFT_6104 [Calcarisporiella thermophila]|uniref:uncharacterized protein n=1 Tax=Calcarisporiella thermophila TaxID=911321 RepID=UPI003744759C
MASTSNVLKASDLVNGQLYNDLSLKDLEWTLAGGSSSETQTWYFYTKTGKFGFVQLLHSNIGIFYPTIQYNCRFFGEGISLWKSVNSSGFKLSPDRRSASCDGMSIQLNPEGTLYTVSLKIGNETFVSFQFEKIDRGFKIGEGKTFLGSDSSSTNFVSHKFLPKGRITGVLVHNGVEHELEGDGLFVHAIQGLMPHLIASKWNFVNLQGPEGSVCMIQFETTPQYGNVRVNQGAVVVDNKLIGVSVENEVEYVESELDAETGYHVPTETRYTWKGKCVDDDTPFSVTIQQRPTVLVDKIDVLSEVPYFLRKLVQAFVAKPFVYQWFDDSKAEIVIGDRTITLEGKVFHECTFIN